MTATINGLKRQLNEVWQALQQSEQRFRDVVERNADGILVVDRNGIICYVNRTAERLLARSADELIGSPFGFPTVAGQMTEIDLPHRDHETAVAEMHVTESEWDGRPVYVVTLRDVTAREQEKLAVKT